MPPDNLGAYPFYNYNNFGIDGFDANEYKGTKQEGKADILFYLEAKQNKTVLYQKLGEEDESDILSQ